VSEGDIEDYVFEQLDERDDAIAATELDTWLDGMRDAPLNGFDVSWEAHALWGENPEDPNGSAYVWKVGDEVDFDDLADDLTEKGYAESSAAEQPVFSADLSDVDGDIGLIGGVYPPAPMLNVLLVEDEQLVAASGSPDSLAEVAAVISDDDDSLADAGSMDDLIDAAKDDTEIAVLRNGASEVCRNLGNRLPPQVLDRYRDLGVPDGRALFIMGGDASASLVLRYPSESAAEDDLGAREALLAEGEDVGTMEPFDQLGSFDIERDGDLLLIDQEYDDGTARALAAEHDGGGAGFCPSQDDAAAG
jgi:hypothetical protein